MKLVRPILVFVLIMSTALGVSYLIHRAVMAENASIQELLPGFYVMNAALGMLIGVAIIYLSEIRPEITGFSFMGGSLLKFAVFFLIFFPELSDEEAVRKSQFLAFFMPYAVSMIIEVWYLIRYLNQKA